MVNRRIIYFFITSITVLLGLASRRYMFIFPTIIAPFIGDALWAMMVYFGFRFLFPSYRPLNSLVFAIIFSFSIEFSQLYQADWINQLRATTLGGLILGHGFLMADLISYSIGIILGSLIDASILKFNSKHNTNSN